MQLLGCVVVIVVVLVPGGELRGPVGEVVVVVVVVDGAGVDLGDGPVGAFECGGGLVGGGDSHRVLADLGLLGGCDLSDVGRGIRLRRKLVDELVVDGVVVDEFVLGGDLPVGVVEPLRVLVRGEPFLGGDVLFGFVVGVA